MSTGKTLLSSIFFIEFFLGRQTLLYRPHPIPSFRSRDSGGRLGQAPAFEQDERDEHDKSKAQGFEAESLRVHPVKRKSGQGLIGISHRFGLGWLRCGALM